MIHNRTSKGVPLTMRHIAGFIKRNREQLLISVQKKWTEPAYVFKTPKNDTAHPLYTKGIKGAWFMGHGCDSYYLYSENGKVGYEVFNACAHFVIAIEARLWQQKCFVTGVGMSSGFVFSGETFLTPQALGSEIKRMWNKPHRGGLQNYQEAYDAGLAYWTSWEDEPPQFREEADGVLTQITQDLHI